MTFKFTLLHILLLFTVSAGAQSMTGVWRGYFAQSNFGFYEDRYKFEVQLDQAANNALHGVTYSYKTTVFYGKAMLQGIYTPKTSNIIINEINLVELKIDGESQACLMTCYLEYAKMGNLETLTGTYTSRIVKGKGDCGEGKVYLERTTYSDFYKEDFLLKKEHPKKKPADVAKKPENKQTPPAVRRPNPVSKTPNLAGATKLRIKPGAEDAVTKTPKPVTKTPVIPPSPPTVHEEIPLPKVEQPKPKPMDRVLPRPEVMKRRNNELVKTIFTSAREIKIELYDNGEIDGDTITVYHNNKLIVSKKRLTDKPITFTIQASEEDATHEFVMVAENLGSIPPNTALMVITAGGKRYELFITSTEQKNAVVEIEYKATDAP